MKVITLFENNTISKEYRKGHGLSLYIETSGHKILFDMGKDDAFEKNANKLGVKLEDVDTAIISHGHYDHGKGLGTFLELNKKAKVYIGKGAFDNHLTKLLGFIKLDLGLKKDLQNSDRLVFIDDMVKIDDELIIFSNVKGSKLVPKGNNRLLKEYGDGSIKADDFEHEINLLVNENDRYSLFCGCAHRGIINIIDRAKEITGKDMKTVIGGFHLMGMDVNNADSKEFLNELSKNLLNNNSGTYYTCHCTSEEIYKYLKQKMKNLNEIKTGMTIEI